jgi:aspartyl-tRNA(Asn)/glutamyl-tRNA(Gln) amidotransferase subunit B
MESVYDKYEPVIGLEVHIQLSTETKAYSSDENTYGAIPNTNVSFVSLGHPGTLPVFNKKTIEYAVKLGLATHSHIEEDVYFARKNYFYADLPKGYQITQDKTPICIGGFIQIKDKEGNTKKVNITRIHMEEDAGKSIHDQDPYNTLIDLNRAGTPLLEIVSEPEISSADEAYKYVYEVRKLVRYLEVCDGNMEEGSLRCDVNISVMPIGSKIFGKKVEVKNMNSIRNVQKAINFEIIRQIDEIEDGKAIVQETRGFDASSGSTFSMRTKELAMDYRYFPEPDLQPLKVTREYISKIKSNLPPLPNELYKRFRDEYQLSEYDSLNLTESKGVALYFEAIVAKQKDYKSAANLIMGPVKSYLNDKNLDIEDYLLSPNRIAEIITLINTGEISSSAVTQKIFPLLYANPELGVKEIAISNDLIHSSNKEEIKELAYEIINRWPDKVKQYKNGNKNLLGLFMGELMKSSKGNLDPKVANQLIQTILEE